MLFVAELHLSLQFTSAMPGSLFLMISHLSSNLRAKFSGDHTIVNTSAGGV